MAADITPTASVFLTCSQPDPCLGRWPCPAVLNPTSLADDLIYPNRAETEVTQMAKGTIERKCLKGHRKTEGRC